MLRCLVSSNAAHSSTGYATETRGIVKAIQDCGHEVAVQAWWGLEGGPAVINNVQHFPRHLDGYGNDAAAYYCRKWKADILITLIDLWVLDPNLGHMGHTKWAPLYPVDHTQIPVPIGARFAHAHRLLCYSESAVKLTKEYEGGRYADRVRYLPHGIDCNILRPAGVDEKKALRRKYYPDWPENSYIVGMVAANKGLPSRKSFPEAFEAFARFAAKYPEARLYLHSYEGQEFKGWPLQELLRHFGIAEHTRLANPQMLLAGDYTDPMMRDLYCTMDVLMSPSQGEGFGLPIVEAQSCGVPVIVTDHSAMTENVGVGWRVPPLREQTSLLLADMAVADVPGVYHALEESYRRPASPYWQAIAREFALKFDWGAVTEKYWRPFLDEMDGGRRELAQELEEARRGDKVAV